MPYRWEGRKLLFMLVISRSIPMNILWKTYLSCLTDLSIKENLSKRCDSRDKYILAVTKLVLAVTKWTVTANDRDSKDIKLHSTYLCVLRLVVTQNRPTCTFQLIPDQAIDSNQLHKCRPSSDSNIFPNMSLLSQNGLWQQWPWQQGNYLVVFVNKIMKYPNLARFMVTWSKWPVLLIQITNYFKD